MDLPRSSMQVVILSRDRSLYSTRSLVGAYEEAGYQVEVLDALTLEVKVGRGVYYSGERLCPDLIIPRFSSQLLVAGLAVLREWEREGRGIMNSAASLSVASDQLATLQALSSEGLPVPETSFCSQPEDEATFDSMTGQSARVIKLLDSSQGRGVTLANNPQTARSVLSTLATLRSSGVTQKYYAESRGEDRRLLVYQGQVIASIKRSARAGEFRANIHQGGSAESYEPSAEESDLALRATAALGLDLAGVDLIYTEEGYKILEVNASPGLEGVEQGHFMSISRCLV